jgi:hypothetical protein
VYRANRSNGLELDDHCILNHEIGSKTKLDPEPIIAHWKSGLAREAQAELPQLVFEENLIRGFEEPNSDSSAHAHGRTDDRMGQRVVLFSNRNRHGLNFVDSTPFNRIRFSTPATTLPRFSVFYPRNGLA